MDFFKKEPCVYLFKFDVFLIGFDNISLSFDENLEKLILKIYAFDNK